MKRKLLVILFALPILLMSPVFAQSQETVQTIMTNNWVKKYKKLKTDLENKAVHVKDMDNISKADRTNIEKSYEETSRRLELWLDNLITQIDLNNQVVLNHLASGGMEPELKSELLGIFTFYSNNFATQYEDITGEGVQAIMSNSKLMEDGEQNSNIKVPVGKVEKEFLIANVKMPLSPTAWDALY